MKNLFLIIIFLKIIFSVSALNASEKNINLDELHINIKNKINDTLKKIHIFENKTSNLENEQIKLTKILTETFDEEHRLKIAMKKVEEKIKNLKSQKADFMQEYSKLHKKFIKNLINLEQLVAVSPSFFSSCPEKISSMMHGTFFLSTILKNMQHQLKNLSIALKKIELNEQGYEKKKDFLKNNLEEQKQKRENTKTFLVKKIKSQNLLKKKIAEQKIKSVKLAAEEKEISQLLENLSNETSWKRKKILNYFKKMPKFDELKGQLPYPADGNVISSQNKKNFPLFKGVAIETEPDTLVRSPLDAFIAYAGKFRSFGNIVILNVKDHYNILLAGLDVIYFHKKQFVAKGEPIGMMGKQYNFFDVQAFENGYNQKPLLYIEFREKNQFIDSAPWWQTISSKGM